jgi:hypothetical protein
VNCAARLGNGIARLSNSAADLESEDALSGKGAAGLWNDAAGSGRLPPP